MCDACIYSENKEKIDWSLREDKLLEMLSKFRKNDGSYDCIFKGEKIALHKHILKYKYGMNPLTATYTYFIH